MSVAAAWSRRLAAFLLVAAAACGGQAACLSRAPVTMVERHVTTATSTATSTVAVPDSIPAAWRNERVGLRYRVAVGDCTGDTAALWLFRVGAPYVLRADDGRPLPMLSTAGRPFSARSDARSVHNGRIPALYALPPGTRHVDIDLLAPPYVPSGLVRAEIGPSELLLPVQAYAFDQVVAFGDASSGIVLVLGALALVLWTQ
ncbi:MAG: hypothetical protein EOO24_44035, partial [Comamonadaceae bacterium]